MTLDDLRHLFLRFVPPESRHPHADGQQQWWPAHEIGHLLTVPASAIGVRMFGLDDDNGPLSEHERRCRELAAMSVSWRLLKACGRHDLAEQELEETDYDTVDYSYEPRARRRVRAILRAHRCVRLPRTTAALEAKLRMVTEPKRLREALDRLSRET